MSAHSARRDVSIIIRAGGTRLIIRYGTDRETATVLFGMSAESENVGPSTEVQKETSPEENDLLFAVPVIAGVGVMLFGSLFINVASLAPGGLAFGAVASTMVGVLIVGFASAVALFVGSVVDPWLGETQEHETS